MKRNIFKNIVPAAALMLTVGMASCVNDLDKGNIDPTVEADVDISALYTKCYAGLIMEGNDGAADFSIDDAGKSTLIRNIYNFNELPTDESICWWSDGGIVEIGYNQWEPGHASLKFLYYRIMSNITYCNKYIKEAGNSSDAMLAEVRFLRAYYYYLLMDFFADPPFIDENTLGTSDYPVQAHAMNGETITDRQQMVYAGRKNLYDWIMKELDACEPSMLTAKPESDSETDYGRADKAAVWFLKSRMLLNSNIYLNLDDSSSEYQANLQQVVSLSDQIAAAGYGLCTKSVGDYHAYDLLFMGDNGSNGAQVESILPLMQDGKTTQGWGGSLFFIACHWNADLRTVTGQGAGTTGNTWAGMRCRPTFVNKFNVTASGTEGKTASQIREESQDDRALFCGLEEKVNDDGTITFTPRSSSLGKNSEFAGVASVKWNNNYSTGASPHDTYYVDTDFLLFRFGETVLNKAEALLRLGQTDAALAAVNTLRVRANADPLQILNMSMMLDERAREMYLEGMRRIDLIRFHQFGGQQATYKWEFKGGVDKGINFDEYRNVYPIPTSEIDANSNLTQIYGY